MLLIRQRTISQRFHCENLMGRVACVVVPLPAIWPHDDRREAIKSCENTRKETGKRNVMVARHSCWSRRAAIGAALGGSAAALLSRIVAAQAADKMTRAQAEYQDSPNGLYSCGMCSLFEGPNGCKVVEGGVSKDGWCKAFALQD
jgi:hypothetical protein